MNKKNKIIIMASCFVVSMVLCYIGQTNSDYYDVTSSNIDAIVRTTGGDNVTYLDNVYQPTYLDALDPNGTPGGSTRYYRFPDENSPGENEYVIVNGNKEYKCVDDVYTSPRENAGTCYKLFFRL